MTDEEFVYRQEIRDKAVTARSAKKTPMSRRRRVRLPSDQISRKEWKKMNGPVHQVKLGAPMPWDDFRALPVHMQKEYIDDIVKRYSVGPAAISKMFGISSQYCGNYLRKLGYAFPDHTKPGNAERFLSDFGKGDKTTSQSAPTLTNTPMALQNVSITFSGAFSPAAITKKLSCLFPAGANVVVTVTVEAADG